MTTESKLRVQLGFALGICEKHRKRILFLEKQMGSYMVQRREWMRRAAEDGLQREVGINTRLASLVATLEKDLTDD